MNGLTVVGRIPGHELRRQAIEARSLQQIPLLPAEKWAELFPDMVALGFSFTLGGFNDEMRAIAVHRMRSASPGRPAIKKGGLDLPALSPSPLTHARDVYRILFGEEPPDSKVVTAMRAVYKYQVLVRPRERLMEVADRINTILGSIYPKVIREATNFGVSYEGYVQSILGVRKVKVKKDKDGKVKIRKPRYIDKYKAMTLQELKDLRENSTDTKERKTVMRLLRKMGHGIRKKRGPKNRKATDSKLDSDELERRKKTRDRRERRKKRKENSDKR